VFLHGVHHNPTYVQLSHEVSQRQGKWTETLTSYNCIIEYVDAKKHPAGGLTTRHNYEIGYENTLGKFLPTLAVTTVTGSYSDLLQDITGAQGSNHFTAEIQPTLAEVLISELIMWRSVDGALTYERRICVPVALHGSVCSQFQENLESSHLGVLMTAKLLSWDVCYPVMESEIWRCVAGCKLCHQINALCHTHYGLNMPLSPPSQLGEELTMHFITDFP